MNNIFLMTVLFLLASCSFWERVSTENTPEQGLVYKMDEAYIYGPYPMSMELSAQNGSHSYPLILQLQSKKLKVLPDKSLKVLIDGREVVMTHSKINYFDKYGKEHVALAYTVNLKFLKEIVEGKKVIFVVNFENNLAAFGDFSKFPKDKTFGTRLSAKESVQDFLARVE